MTDFPMVGVKPLPERVAVAENDILHVKKAIDDIGQDIKSMKHGAWAVAVAMLGFLIMQAYNMATMHPVIAPAVAQAVQALK